MQAHEIAPAKIGAGELKRLKSATPTCLHCLTGWMLLTIEGDGRDIELRPGQQAWLPAKKLVLVEGEADYWQSPASLM